MNTQSIASSSKTSSQSQLPNGTGSVHLWDRAATLLDKAIPEWLKSDEAKEYLAPRDVAGTGQGAGKPANGTPRTATGQIDEGALASKLLRLTA